MKKLLTILIFFTFSIIIVFLLFSDFEKAISVKLGDQQKIASFSVFSFILLVADIILPVPSSLVMILNGKVLGLAGGTFLSLTSSILSSSLGFYIGRTTSKGLNKFFSEKEIKMGNFLFDKYGNISIALSKGLPILSESVSFLSGNTSISFKRFLFYSFIGHLPVSFIYAFVGSYANTLDSYLVSGGIIIITVCVFFIFQILIRRKAKETLHK